MTDFQPAFADAELSDNDSRAVTISGQKVLVCRAGGTLYAVQNRCTHQRRNWRAVESAAVSYPALYTACALISVMARLWGN